MSDKVYILSYQGACAVAASFTTEGITRAAREYSARYHLLEAEEVTYDPTTEVVGVFGTQRLTGWREQHTYVVKCVKIT